MKEVIEVRRPLGLPSKIVIGEVLDDLADYLPERRVVVITDSNVHRCHRKLSDRFEHIIIGLGETKKTLVTRDKI